MRKGTGLRGQAEEIHCIFEKNFKRKVGSNKHEIMQEKKSASKKRIEFANLKGFFSEFKIEYSFLDLSQQNF